MKLQPLLDYVVIERLKTETTTSGGIFLPDGAKEKSQRGKVIEVGRGRVLENGALREPQVKKGDLVLFTSGAGIEIKIDSEEYLIMSELSIIAVIK